MRLTDTQESKVSSSIPPHHPQKNKNIHTHKLLDFLELRGGKKIYQNTMYTVGKYSGGDRLFNELR